MAYAYADPASIDCILQRAQDELRRGENQHCRTAEAQYTNHVKELLGNLERYLETCGVRLPAEVLEGPGITASASAVGSQESEQTVLGEQRAIPDPYLGGKSVPASATVVRSTRGSNASAISQKSVGHEWGNLATPCQAPGDTGAEITHHVVSRGLIKVPTSTLQRAPKQSEQVGAMFDSSSSPLGAAYPHRSAPSNRCGPLTNSDSGASIFYSTQQATRAHTAYPSPLPLMVADAGADGSGDNGNVPIVAIMGSGLSGANGTISRECSGSLAIRSPLAPSHVSSHYTGTSQRGDLYTLGDSVSQSSSIRPAALDATTSHERWSEFGALVQSVTDSRRNSNMVSLESAPAARCPLSDGVIGCLAPTHPSPMRNAETDKSGAPAMQLPAASSGGEDQLPHGIGGGSSLTTPPTSSLAVAAEGQVLLSPSKLSCAQVLSSPLSPPVAHGTGSRAVRALSTAAAAAEPGCNRNMTKTDAVTTRSISQALFHCQTGETTRGLPQVECISSPPQQTRPSRPEYSMHVGIPMHRAASVPLAAQRLYTGGNIVAHAPENHQYAHHHTRSPYTTPSSGGAAVPKVAESTVLAKNSKKEELMSRLQKVLERSVPAPSSVQQSAVSSASAQHRRSSLSENAAQRVGERETSHTGVTNAPAPPMLHPTQRMQYRSAMLANVVKSSYMPHGSADVLCATSPSAHTNGGEGGNATQTGAQNDSWFSVQIPTTPSPCCPYNHSDSDTNMEAATSHSVSQGTRRPEEGDTERINSVPHTPMGAPHARGVDSSTGVKWDRDSSTTVMSTPARQYTHETMAPSPTTSLHRYPSSPQAGTSWTRRARNPQLHGTSSTAIPSASASGGHSLGRAKSNIDNSNRWEEVEAQKTHLMYSEGENGIPIDKQQLMQRLRMVLGRVNE